MTAVLAPTVSDTPESRYNQLPEPTFEDLAHFPGAPKSDRSLWRLYQIMRDPCALAGRVITITDPLVAALISRAGA